jgi:hypothetical protein
MGKLESPIVSTDWHDEVLKISLQQVPSPIALKTLQEELISLSVKYVIPGHGSCLSV